MSETSFGQFVVRLFVEVGKGLWLTLQIVYLSAIIAAIVWLVGEYAEVR